MQVRFLKYLVAVAQEQHFARAAAACGVSQPTLSAGLAALEDALGVRLVDRERRFMGLTPEGEAALPWAQAMLADHRALKAATKPGATPLLGEVRLGIIPAAMPASGRLVRALLEDHPDISVSLRSMTSREIASGLVAQEIHAGLTYLCHEPLPQMVRVPLARERYIFVTGADAPLARLSGVRWESVAREPLCLLHQGMQNRRILDEHLARRGLAIRPVAVTDSYVTLIAMVAAGGLSTIISDSYAPLISGAGPVRMIPFADPAPANLLGLVVMDRPTLPPASRAVLASARALAAVQAGAGDWTVTSEL